MASLFGARVLGRHWVCAAAQALADGAAGGCEAMESDGESAAEAVRAARAAATRPPAAALGLLEPHRPSRSTSRPYHHHTDLEWLARSRRLMVRWWASVVQVRVPGVRAAAAAHLETEQSSLRGGYRGVTRPVPSHSEAVVFAYPQGVGCRRSWKLEAACGAAGRQRQVRVDSLVGGSPRYT